MHATAPLLRHFPSLLNHKNWVTSKNDEAFFESAQLLASYKFSVQIFSSNMFLSNTKHAYIRIIYTIYV